MTYSFQMNEHIFKNRALKPYKYNIFVLLLKRKTQESSRSQIIIRIIDNILIMINTCFFIVFLL